MFNWIKKIVTDTPLESAARRLYIRLDQNDRETIAVMRHCLAKNSNCIDIGAHRGSILNEIVSLAPQGRHFTFEPVPVHYQYLVRFFPTVNIYSYALSNQKGQASFIHNIGHPTRSGFQNLVDPNALTETIFVETELLDNIIPSDLKIQFIKLDVEGAEALVIHGGLNTIKKNKPFIIFEHSKPIQTGREFASENLFQLLAGECGLIISTLRNWSKREPSLDRSEFITTVDIGREYYFIAYPP